MRTAHPATKKLVQVAWYSAVTPRLGKLFLIYRMVFNEHSYDEGKDESYYDELMDKETLRLPRTKERGWKVLCRLSFGSRGKEFAERKT